MRSKSMNVKPSLYPALPFHIIRGVSLLSSLIVAIILAVFIYQLHTSSHRLPWTFLVLLIASVVSLLNYILTTLLHCGYGLSPRLSLTTNGICLTIWAIALGLLSWSMWQTIMTTCTTTYWVTSTGISVCRIYKTLFSFTIIGTAASVAACVLDIVIRNRQTRLGEYDPMASNAMLSNEMKLEDRNSVSPMSGGLDPLGPHPSERLHHDDVYAVPEPVHGYNNVPPPPSYGGSNHGLEDYHAGEAQQFYESAPMPNRRPGQRVRFDGDYDYSHPTQQTSYDPAAYR